jgi:membrane protein required for colicin V production
MTPYDGIMAGVVIAGMVWGALRGITWQVASLASLILGYAVAFPVSGQLAPHLPGQPIVARAVALLLTYVTVSGGIFGVAWIIRTTLRKLKFEAYDRHLGMLLGGAEGALLASVVTVFVLSIAPGTRGPILGSPTGRLLGTVLKQVEPVLPGEVRAELEPFWGRPAAAHVTADAEWQDLKKPLTDAREPEAPDDSSRPITHDRPRPGHVVAGVIEQGVERLEDTDEDTTTRRIGRAMADTLENEINRIGGPQQPGDSRKRRIGRAMADLIGDQLDRMSTPRDERDRGIRRR